MYQNSCLNSKLLSWILVYVCLQILGLTFLNSFSEWVGLLNEHLHYYNWRFWAFTRCFLKLIPRHKIRTLHIDANKIYFRMLHILLRLSVLDMNLIYTLSSFSSSKCKSSFNIKYIGFKNIKNENIMKGNRTKCLLEA